MSIKPGGYGLDPYGRHQFGNAGSVIEPRFETSDPTDGETGVSVVQNLQFTTYCFSSFIDIPDIRIYISENGGSTFVQAFNGTSFILPYSGSVRRKDGQRIVFFLRTATQWDLSQEIVVRFDGEDEYGNLASKVTCQTWS